MRTDQQNLRLGSAAAGERLPTVEQCADQREDFEHAERAELDGVQHISGLIDVVMARIRQRVAKRKEAQRGQDSHCRSRCSR